MQLRGGRSRGGGGGGEGKKEGAGEGKGTPDDGESSGETGSEPSWLQEMKERCLHPPPLLLPPPHVLHILLLMLLLPPLHTFSDGHICRCRKRKGLPQILSEESELSGAGGEWLDSDKLRRADEELTRRRQARSREGGTAGEDDDMEKEEEESSQRGGGLKSRIDDDDDDDEEAARINGRQRGAIDGLSSDSDFGGGGGSKDDGSRRSDGSESEEDEEREGGNGDGNGGAKTKRAVLEMDGEVLEIPGKAGTDIAFLTEMQKAMAKSGLEINMKVPTEGGKLKSLRVSPVDADDAAADDDSGSGKHEEMKPEEMYGAKMDRRTYERIKDNLFFEVEEDDVMSGSGGGGGGGGDDEDDDGVSKEGEDEGRKVKKSDEGKRMMSKSERKRERHEKRNEREKKEREVDVREGARGKTGRNGSHDDDDDHDDGGLNVSKGTVGIARKASEDEGIVSFREANQAKVEGWDARPFLTFDQAMNAFGKRLLASCKGFTKPTPIQVDDSTFPTTTLAQICVHLWRVTNRLCSLSSTPERTEPNWETLNPKP